MKNEKKVLLRDVNQYITCYLCSGYLIDATTITECLHTFCKTCIVKYLEDNTDCPICHTLLHQSHPLLYISHDRTLQTIVYKLVANLEKDEIERQVKYYNENKLEYPINLKEKLENDAAFFHLKQKIKSNDAGVGDSAAPAVATTSIKTEQNSSTGQNSDVKNNNTRRNDEQIMLSLEPSEGLCVNCFYFCKHFFVFKTINNFSLFLF